METILALLINLASFIFAFFLGRFSKPTLTREQKKEILRKVKSKVTGKTDDSQVQIISPHEKTRNKEFLEEATNES